MSQSIDIACGFLGGTILSVKGGYRVLQHPRPERVFDRIADARWFLAVHWCDQWDQPAGILTYDGRLSFLNQAASALKEVFPLSNLSFSPQKLERSPSRNPSDRPAPDAFRNATQASASIAFTLYLRGKSPAGHYSADCSSIPTLLRSKINKVGILYYTSTLKRTIPLNLHPPSTNPNLPP